MPKSSQVVLKPDTYRRLKKFVDETGMFSLKDISSAAVDDWLTKNEASLRKALSKEGK